MCIRNGPRTNRIMNYLQNKENRREVSSTKYWENSDKERAASQANNTDKGSCPGSFSWPDPVPQEGRGLAAVACCTGISFTRIALAQKLSQED